MYPKLRESRVLLTGGRGFLGGHILAELERSGVPCVVAPSSSECDLRLWDAVEVLLRSHRPDVVIHTAARTGGIGLNRRRPGHLFFENLLMGTQLLELARRHAVKKFVGIGTVCSYPRHCPLPMREADLWNGYPEETNAAYGLAKKMLLVQSQAYRDEYGFNAIHLLISNLYGPADDWDEASSHVIPALISRFATAEAEGLPRVVCWGDGNATRDFLFAEDAARAVCLAADSYDGREPLNIGTGVETSIADLAQQIANLTGYRGAIDWDPSLPNGQPRRVLDVSAAESLLGWQACTALPDGLRQTVEWFHQARARPSTATPMTTPAPERASI